VRVLHVSPYFAPAFRYGGPPRSILGLCHALVGCGVEVEVVTTTANGDASLPASAPDGDSYEGIPVHYTARAFPRRFFGARLRAPLAAALARADLCHVHGIWNAPEWAATRLAASHHVPYVLSPRGMLLPAATRRKRWQKKLAYGLWERANLAGAALLHATSDEEADGLRARELGVPVVMVPNGVDLPGPATPQPGIRARLGLASDARLIVFVGRIHPIKRLDLLADAFAQVRTTHPAAHLVLAGADEVGHLPTVIRRLAAQTSFVHAVGELADAEVGSLLADAAVSVQCSDSESFGMAVVEAMAAGVPVVVTRTCPWREIETRDCGFWVEQSASAIAAAIRTLLDDPIRAAAMGARGAALVRERYSWEAVGRAMANHYAGVLARDPAHHVA
jgi:glycosyltransferase involved in cell wall biosynthesis